MSGILQYSSLVLERELPPAAQISPFSDGEEQAGGINICTALGDQKLPASTYPCTVNWGVLQPGLEACTESASLDWHSPFCQACLSAAVHAQIEAGSRKSRGSPGEFLCSELRPACQADFWLPS